MKITLAFMVYFDIYSQLVYYFILYLKDSQVK